MPEVYLQFEHGNKHEMADAVKLEVTVTYVRDLVHELAELAHSVGCNRLYLLLHSAALEAEFCSSSSRAAVWPPGKSRELGFSLRPRRKRRPPHPIPGSSSVGASPRDGCKPFSP